MADYATGITASVPALDMVVVDTPTLGWWTGRGFVGRSSAGFETMLAVAPATVALTEPSWTLDPRVELWRHGHVTAICHLGMGGVPPSLTSGTGTMTFDPDNLPDRFVFLWPLGSVSRCPWHLPWISAQRSRRPGHAASHAVGARLNAGGRVRCLATALFLWMRGW